MTISFSNNVPHNGIMMMIIIIIIIIIMSICYIPTKASGYLACDSA
jgi:hypothetical protein